MTAGCEVSKDTMKSTELYQALRYRVIKGVVDGLWIFMLFHPVFIWYLWRFWWLRPIIIWYSPYTLLLLYNYQHFILGAVFCFLTNGGQQSVLKPYFMRFQLFLTYTFYKVMHGLEIHGLRNLPKGAGLVVYYHAPCLPVDVTHLFSLVYLKYGRMIGGSTDRNWHRNKFFGPSLELYDYSSERERFVQDLKDGHLRSCGPGGAYEAMFSKEYSLEWKSRIGFARIAKETGVPVVPMFTTNIQHSMPLTAFSKSDTMKEWYALVKRPLCVPKCYLPVKLRTYLGEALICGKDEEPEAFAQRVKKAIESLRDKHQPRNQTYWGALLERLW